MSHPQLLTMSLSSSLTSFACYGLSVSPHRSQYRHGSSGQEYMCPLTSFTYCRQLLPYHLHQLISFQMSLLSPHRYAWCQSYVTFPHGTSFAYCGYATGQIVCYCSLTSYVEGKCVSTIRFLDMGTFLFPHVIL